MPLPIPSKKNLLLRKLFLAFNGPNWVFLRDIRQNKIIASMGIWLAVVPLLSKLLYEIDDILWLSVAGQQIKLHMTLPFSWQTLFFAALSFSIGNLLVSMLCPKIVVENKNFAEFEAAGMTMTQLREYEESLHELPLYVQNRLLNAANLGRRSTPYTEPKLEFWRIYSLQKNTMLFFRWCCTVFYLVGFSLLTDILLKQISWVFRTMKLDEYMHQLVFWPFLKMFVVGGVH
ncbi:hypothetical protein [Herbaspirillum sp. NPDC101397]|uniref:hypothetical protein n=1 Tax=Herbaspirillum sp. NPDC101397 TaxID=3364006 RepID=UPI00383B8BCB